MIRNLGWVLFLSVGLTPRNTAQTSADLFDAPRYYHTGTDMDWQAAGDLDGDGYAELVGTTHSPWGYEVWDNSGNLTLQRHSAVVPAGSPIWGIDFCRLVDLTGDNQPDLIADTFLDAANQGLSVHPWLANNTFGAGILLPLAVDATHLEFGDFNGDNITDLLESHYFSATDETYLQYWSFDGSSFVAHSLLDLTALDQTFSLAVIDYDGDGLDDVLRTNVFDPEIRVLLNVNGSLTLGPTLPVAGSVGYSRAFAEDLDGDADQDILSLAWDPATGEVYSTRFLNHGAGQFAQGPLHIAANPNGAYDFNISRIYPCDWDGDSDLDLVTDFFSVSFLENLGSAQFQFAGNVFTSRNGETFAPTDLNGDGHPDFVEEDSIIVGDGTFKHYLLDEEEVPNAHFGLPRDWEGDGDVDLLSDFGDLFRNDGTGALKDRGNKWPVLSGAFLWGAVRAVGDFDGDNRLDYLVDYNQQITPYHTKLVYVAFLRDDGAGGYTFVPAGPAGVGISGSIVADYDSDGDLDLVGPGTQWLNDGSGYFVASASPFPSFLLDAGDADGDRDLDYLCYSNGQVCLLRDTGGLQFTSEVLYTVAFMNQVQFLDLDDDQDLDIAVLANVREDLHLLENVNSSFSLAQIISGDNSRVPPGAFVADDLDGDGRSDLLLLWETYLGVQTSYLEAHFRQASGVAYDPPIAWLARPGLTSFADMDSDGDLDVTGRFLVRGHRYSGDEAGLLRQYRAGTAGTGDVRPILGANGPTRPGSQATIRVRRAVGGTVGLLAVGLAESDIPGSPWPHTTSFCEPWLLFRLFLIGGTPGEASAGSLDLTFPVLDSFAGLRAFHQVFVVDDAAPSKISSTGGLEILFGE